MTPTLIGRLQTRLLIALAVGLPALVVVGIVLGLGAGRSIVIGLVLAALSIAWEPVWHGLQQLRWDRDWPSAFGLLAGVPEAVVGKVVLALVSTLPLGARWGAYLVTFAVAWVLGWMAEQGPLRVLLPAWRFEGGRVLARRAVLPATHLAELLEPAAATPVTPVAPVAAMSGGPSRTRPGSSSGRGAGPKSPPRKGSARRPAPQGHGSRGRRRGMVLVGVVTALAFVAFTVLDLSPHHESTPAARPSPSPLRTVPPAPHPQPWTAPPGQKVLSSWDTRTTVAPYALTVPTLKLQAMVEPVAMTGGSIASPVKPADVGWYSASTPPGRTGPAVLIGTTRGGPFARIRHLVHGDTLLVTRSDATTVQYVVNRIQKAHAGAFPSGAVYGRTPRPTLRLVGFAPRGAGRTYTIVFATAVHLLQPETTP